VQVLSICFEASVGIPLASASRAGRESAELDFLGLLHKSRGVCSILFAFVFIFAFIFVSSHSRVHIEGNVKFKCGDGVP
jgi:hypothetical protein